MELLTAIIKEYSASVNISMEITLLQQLLPELASQERMLKQKGNANASTGKCSRMNKEVGSLKNTRCKFTKLAKLTNFTSGHVSIHQNARSTNETLEALEFRCQYCGLGMQRRNKEKGEGSPVGGAYLAELLVDLLLPGWLVSLGAGVGAATAVVCQQLLPLVVDVAVAARLHRSRQSLAASPAAGGHRRLLVGRRRKEERGRRERRRARGEGGSQRGRSAKGRERERVTALGRGEGRMMRMNGKILGFFA
ncbi:hypothetical protein H5410_047618 [Solanum commersonii]|uniref:Uncharacterized protein n=1 Tax=Solanum commersonii TaxID=4109 RepID=A0A9J5XJL7_SOLCO|nr:hypothetical protein H5410_047618 [Solanum commersonii]